MQFRAKTYETIFEDMASDARDILNESVPTPPPVIGQKKASKSKRKRPEGMNLELYSLLGSGNDPCPLVPTHASQGGYKVSFYDSEMTS